MRFLLFLLCLVFISCHSDENITIMDDSGPTHLEARLLNGFPGCVTLEFPGIESDRNHLQITNLYGWIISDTVLSQPVFRILRHLEPDQEYFYKISGPQAFEGSFRTTSISSFIQGDYHLEVNKTVTQEQNTYRHSLKDALVEIIKIDEKSILIFWPQRQSRLLNYNNSTCQSIQYSSSPEDDGVTYLNIRLQSDSISIHDRRVINNEITQSFDIRGQFN